jgi:hypothetical protein
MGVGSEVQSSNLRGRRKKMLRGMRSRRVAGLMVAVLAPITSAVQWNNCPAGGAIRLIFNDENFPQSNAVDDEYGSLYLAPHVLSRPMLSVLTKGCIRSFAAMARGVGWRRRACVYRSD